MSEKPTYQELEQRIADLEQQLSERKRQQSADKTGHALDSCDSESAYLHSIINNTQNAIYVRNIGGRFVLVNPGFCKIFGLKAGDALGRTPFELFPEEVAVQHLENDRQVTRLRKSLTFNEQTILADGVHEFVSIKFPILGKADDIIAIGGISTDITDRVRTEEQLQKNQERWRLTFQTSPDAINLNRMKDGIFIDVNEGFIDLTGYRREEIIGQSSLALNIWENLQDRQRLLEMLMQKGYVNNLEARFIRKSGEVGIGLMSARKIRIDDEDVILSITRDITGLKQTQEILQRSEEMSRLLLEQANAIVWTVDKNLRFTSSRGAGLAKLGLQQGQLVGRYLLDFLADEHEASPTVSAVRQALDGRSVSYDEIQGGLIWETRIEPLRDVEGRIVGAVAVSLDITERCRSEALLKSSEQKFKAIINASPMGIHLYELTSDGRLVFVGANPASDRLLSVDHRQFIGKTIEEAFPKLMDTEVPQKYREAARNGTNWRTEQIEYCEGLIKGAFEVAAFQTEPGKMAALFNEITARKQAELARKESEERLAAFLEYCPDAFFVHDLQGKLLQINKAACEELGYSRDELIGMTVTNIQQSMPADEAERIWRAVADGATASYEVKMKRKDGSTFPMDFTIAAVKIHDQQILFGFARDITERKQMEKDKEKFQSQLIQAQKMEAIGTLAGGIAHDFNNLLMGIQGRASIMSIELESAHPCVDHVSAILEYTRSAADLTKQLLGVAQGGKYEISPVDINELVGTSAKMFGRTKKEIRIHRTLCAPSPVALADRRQIEQVLINLYINAWQAMPDGGDLYLETAVVSLDEAYCRPFDAQPGLFARISITDTGIGMDAKVREKIFDPFFTTKGKGRGTGLGLASAYGIVKNHGGLLSVYSEVGKGATFNVYLPVSQEKARDGKIKASGLSKGSGTILLIDDEPMIIEVGTAMLEKLGYRVQAANGGRSALDLIPKVSGQVDLVILDMIMPDVSGDQVFDILKETRPDLPVLLSSGYSLNGQADRIIKKGCVGFIQKPFDMYELSNRLKSILSK